MKKSIITTTGAIKRKRDKKMISLAILVFCVFQRTTIADDTRMREKVHIQAVSSCSAGKSSIVVNQKEWLSSYLYGLFVLSVNDRGTGFESGIKRFFKPMRPNLFDFQREANRDHFTRYFSNENVIKNGTVVVFVTSGLCDKYSFGDWLGYLKSENTGLVFEEKYTGDWQTAVVTACKTQCPDGVNPKSVFGFNAALNLSLDFESREQAKKEKDPVNNGNSSVKLYSIIGIILAVLLLMVSIFVFVFVYRRYYQPKNDNTRRQPTIATTTVSMDEGNPYEDTEYQSVPERSGSNSSDISQHQQQQNYEDLKGSSFKTHISQSSRFSSTKSNTYQGLIGGVNKGGSPSDEDNIYAYIDEASDGSCLKPGTSFNLFKKSLEDLNQDSSKLEKNNFSSYVTVTEKNHNTGTVELAQRPNIYKSPSSVPKFMPPCNNNKSVKSFNEVNKRTSPVFDSKSNSPLYEDISIN